MNWKVFIIVLLVVISSFVCGKWTAKQEQVKQIKELQTSLEYCETKWKLDMHLFFEKEINEICTEEFKQMAC